MKLTIKITTDTGTNAYDIRVGDWLAWEDETGVSQTEFATRGKLSDMAFLAWNAAKRTNPATPDDLQQFADTIVDWDFEVEADLDPTKPAA